jgi:hypothetical protein
VRSLEGCLPDWSGGAPLDDLPATVDEVLGWDELDQAAAIHAYSEAHCFPRFDLPAASGLYVLLRLLFDLPTAHPRDEAQVFGGWFNPSINDGSPTFNLSWPVAQEGSKAAVAPFPGYFGKGYDAAGEYDWMQGTFPRRSAAPAAAVYAVSSG